MQPRAQALVDPGVNSPGRTAGASRVALATSKWCLDVQCGDRSATGLTRSTRL
jgi:hypothetical protein